MMKIGNPSPRSALLLLTGCILIYLLAVAGYAVWSHEQHKAELMAEIDSGLLQAARSLKYLVAPDFHDRALAPDSIDREEELRNRQLVTDFGVEAGFKWVYTLAEKDGEYFFAAPSVSEEEAREQESWYFHPYEDIPEEFIRAFADNQTIFVNYTDQWGAFRSVALPETSPGGRRYLACADREISEVSGLFRQSLRQSILVAAFFLLASLPFIFLLVFLFRAHTAELRHHQEHLEELVQARTAALAQETRRLQEALDNVRLLRGLIPICASCKKVRDDQGYWNQLDLYIQKYSDAEFSHGLCPDCAHTLYPEFAPPPDPAPGGSPPATPPAQA
jgi:ABC-type multidrug transport system fused ATPase/permease subunit